MRRVLDELLGLPVHIGLRSLFPKLRLAKQAFFALQPFVAERKRAAVLEIRRGDSPTTLQVAIEIVIDDTAQGVVGGVLRRAAHLRVSRVSSNRSCMASKTLARKLSVAQSRAAPFLGRFVKCRRKQRYLGEIVEVPGLQRGVLAVVGEAQELAGLGFEVSVALQFDQRADRQDGGRRASVVNAKGRQLGALGALGLGVGDAARGIETEQEVPADERRRDALPSDTIRPWASMKTGSGRSLGSQGGCVPRPAAWFPS